MQSWEEISRMENGRAQLARVCWPYDKYPDLPQLLAGSEIVLLDEDGPGVVTNLHSSRMDYLDDVLGTVSAREPDAYRRVEIVITYDRHSVPDIQMPFCDFLADIDGVCDYFSTIYFSKVRFSHNFRLPLPFRSHIRIALRNPTKTALIGYTDLQWKRLARLPEDVGYLYTAYHADSLQLPEQTAQLCRINARGTLRAHWFSLGTDCPLAKNGEYICEGNQSFFVDEEKKPSLEYLGTEDVYSHSWGFAGTGGDGYAAITRMEHPTPERTQISMLRCRTIDAIPFERSLRLELDYQDEYFAAGSRNPLHRQGVFAERARASFKMDYKSCLYYYAQKK